MRRQLLSLLAAVLLVPFAQVLAGPPAVAAEPRPTTVHPRLLFSAADVPAMRARVGVPGSVPAQAWERVKAKADGHLIKVQPEVLRTNKSNCLANIEGLECPYNLQNEMPTYLIELGIAYQLSGEEKYGHHAIELLSALGDADFPFWTMEKDLGIGDLLEGVGLAFDWTYQLMTDAERAKIVGDITRMQDRLFVRPLFEYTNEASTYPGSNWMGVTAGGAGLTLLAIRGEQGAPTTYTSGFNPAPPNSNVPAWPVRTYTFDEYLDKAVKQVRTYFRGGFDLEGASLEGMTYAAYGLKNSVPFALAARRDGVGDPFDPSSLPATHCWGGTQYFCLPLDGDKGTGMPNVSRWLAHEQLPGEGQNFVPLNDSQRTQVGVDLPAQLFAINPNDGIAQWLWKRTVGELGTDVYAQPEPAPQVRENKCTQATEPNSFVACDLFNLHGHVWAILFYRGPGETPEVDPESVGPLSIHHAERGLVDARTGFAGGRNEVVSTFEARRNGIPHFQYDIGNFTLYGEGGRWATDPGYDCRACDSRPQAEHMGAYADQHNVVVIDGQATTQHSDSRYALIRNNPVNNRSIDSFVNAPNVSLAHADLRYAYGGYADDSSFVAPYAGRDHLFSRVPGRPTILGISDHVQRDAGTHTYRWQMLTNNDNVVTLDGTGFRIQQGLAGAVLSGRVASGGSVAGDLPVQLRPQLITSPTDDRGKVFPVVYTETAPQLAMDQLAVMALTPAGTEAAATETLRVQGGNAVTVTWRGVQDIVVRKLRSAAEVAPLSALTPQISTDASIAKFSRDDAGARAAETLLRGGTRLTAYGRSYVAVTGTSATVTVSGNEASATGAASNTYRVYAPQPVDKVTVNGTAASSCRDGLYVSFPCIPATALTLSAPASAPATDVATFTASLSSQGAVLPGRRVHFTLGTLAGDAVTDAAGVVRFSLPLDLDAGRYNLTASYPGGYGFAPSSASRALDLTPDMATLRYTGDLQGRGGAASVSAVLSEDAGLPMPGRPVSFSLGGQTVVATTDANGRAATTLSAPDHGRSQQVSVAFAGTARYAPAVTIATVTWGSG